MHQELAERWDQEYKTNGHKSHTIQALEDMVRQRLPKFVASGRWGRGWAVMNERVLRFLCRWMKPA
jgi:hypothetical protein